MSRDEFIGKLQMVYFGDRNAFNEIVGVYDELEKENQRKQLEAYENMRKEAIEYAKSHFKEMVADEEAQILLNILNKVGGSDEK